MIIGNTIYWMHVIMSILYLFRLYLVLSLVKKLIIDGPLLNNSVQQISTLHVIGCFAIH